MSIRKQHSRGRETSHSLIGFRELLGILKPYRKSMVIALLLGVFATLAGAAQPLFVANMVDGFTGRIPTQMLLGLLSLLALSAVLTGFQQLILQRSGEQFAFDRRKRLILHIFALPIGELGKSNRGDLVSRVTTDVAQTRAVLSSGIVELATSLITVIVSMVMMATLDWLLLALAITAIAIVIVAVALIGRRSRPAGFQLQAAVGDLGGSVLRAISAMKTIRSTGAVTREIDAAIKKAEIARNAGFIAARLRAVIQVFSGVTVQLLLITVVAIGALRVAADALTVGELSAFIMYLTLLIAPIGVFANVVSLLGESLGALSRITAVEALDVERDIQDPDADASTTLIDLMESGYDPIFELQNVSFRYDAAASDHDPDVLRNINLSFNKGKTTAIVGPSGSGKSTLFALLERFYEPTQGNIFFRGNDVRSVSRAELRSQIAYVEQDAPALSGTIRDNLLLGANTATEEECISILARVNLVPPDGNWESYLNQQVGEVGSFLSGGERQRLAIARALIARSPVLLLDEVTSNLDSNNERIIQNLIHDDSENRTIIIIAHRLSTVAAADSIVVLAGGEVVANGTHQDLLSISDLYRELAQNQLIA